MIKNGKWIDEKGLEGFYVKSGTLDYWEVSRVHDIGDSFELNGFVLTVGLDGSLTLSGYCEDYSKNYITNRLLSDNVNPGVVVAVSEPLQSLVHNLDDIVDLERLRKFGKRSSDNTTHSLLFDYLGDLYFKGSTMHLQEGWILGYILENEDKFLASILDKTIDLGKVHPDILECFNWDLIEGTSDSSDTEESIVEEKVNDWKDWNVGGYC